MSEMEVQKLNEARAYLCTGNDAEAVGCYAVVAAENPENPEAKFSTCYLDYLDSKEDASKRKMAMIKLINSLEDAVKCVAEADCPKDDSNDRNKAD